MKESTRWIEGYERIAEMASEMPATRLVYVADREADLMPMMLRAHTLGHPADWLVRAAHNRCLPDGDRDWPKVGETAVLNDELTTHFKRWHPGCTINDPTYARAA